MNVSVLTAGGVSTPAGSSSQNTGSFTPTPNGIVRIAVLLANYGGTEPPDPTFAFSGTGLPTFTKERDQIFTDMASETKKLVVFRAKAGATTTAGAITINAADIEGWVWCVTESTDIVPTGTNGGASLAQVNSAGLDSSPGNASPATTLAAFADASINGTLVIVAAFDVTTNISPEEGNGYTALDEVGGLGEGDGSLRVMWKTGQDTTPSASLSASDQWAIVAMEVAGVSAAEGEAFDAAISASATVAASLTTAITLAATLAGSATAAGALTTGIPLAGTAAAAATTSAALTTAIDLAAAVSAAAAASGVLYAPTTFDGSAACSVTAAAQLTTAIPLHAAAAASATVTAALRGSKVVVLPDTPVVMFVAGESLGVVIEGNLVGTVSGAATVVGQLTTSIPLAAAVSATATSTAQLMTEILMAAAVAGSAQASGALSTAIPLSAAVSVSATVAAALTTELKLSGTVDAAAAATASLAAAGELLMDGDAEAAAMASATLTTGLGLDGAAAGAGTVTADLMTAVSLAGSITATATASGSLHTLNAAPRPANILPAAARARLLAAARN